VNCAEIIQDRPEQPAYEMLSIKRRLQRCKVRPKVQWVLHTRAWNLGTPLKCTVSATVH